MTIFQVAQNWLAQDPDAETRAELEQLIQAAESDEKAKAELTARFDGRLQFWYGWFAWSLTSGFNGYEPCFGGTSCQRFSWVY